MAKPRLDGPDLPHADALVDLPFIQRFADVGRSTALGWLQRRLLPIVRLPGRNGPSIIRVRFRDLQAFLDKHRVEA